MLPVAQGGEGEREKGELGKVWSSTECMWLGQHAELLCGELLEMPGSCRSFSCNVLYQKWDFQPLLQVGL